MLTVRGHKSRWRHTSSLVKRDLRLEEVGHARPPCRFRLGGEYMGLSSLEAMLPFESGLYLNTVLPSWSVPVYVCPLSSRPCHGVASGTFERGSRSSCCRVGAGSTARPLRPCFDSTPEIHSGCDAMRSALAAVAKASCKCFANIGKARFVNTSLDFTWPTDPSSALAFRVRRMSSS